MIGAVFGVGGKRLRADGKALTGTVIKVYRCWWFKVNTKPVRISGYDGAAYPHIVTFSYVADGVEYVGRRWLSYTVCPPGAGERIAVYCDPERPRHFAVDTAQFGVRL